MAKSTTTTTTTTTTAATTADDIVVRDDDDDDDAHEWHMCLRYLVALYILDRINVYKKQKVKYKN